MKKIYFILYLILLNIIMTGCSPKDNSGLFYNSFTKNMDLLLSYLNNFINNWGISIIIITIIVKGLILPFALRNYKKQRLSAINMEYAKPELDIVQNKIKTIKEKEKKTPNKEEQIKLRMEQAELQREIFKIYKKYNCSPAILGNLIPILIQAPFITGLYFTLQNPIHSKEILNSNFLFLSLGEKSYILLIIIFIIYLIVGKLSQNMLAPNPAIQNTPESEHMQNLSKTMMIWFTPIMLTFITYTSIAAIGIYFIVSGFLMIFQILLGRKLYPPYIPKNFHKQQKSTKIKLVKR